LFMRHNCFSTLRHCALLALLSVGCGGVSDDGLYGPSDGLAGSGGGSGGAPTGGNGSGGDCDITGTWATFVEVGVEWSSQTIKPGAGTTKQWIISERSLQGGHLIDRARACGIGAYGVPLGSPWFAIQDIPDLGIFNEWTGVRFLPGLFDRSALPTIDIRTTLELQQIGQVRVGDVFNTEAVPFPFGFEGWGQPEWPTDLAALRPLLVDHDGDGKPGMTGDPFTGGVPGIDAVDFNYPRLGVSVDPTVPIPRAKALYMTLRTQAALRGEVVSCDPMRVEGEVLSGSLKIDTHIVDCDVVGTDAPCTEEQIRFIDSNLPRFESNQVSEMVSFKVAAGTTCAEIRGMDFKRITRR
jgi:hypothetical protein